MVVLTLFPAYYLLLFGLQQGRATTRAWLVGTAMCMALEILIYDIMVILFLFIVFLYTVIFLTAFDNSWYIQGSYSLSGFLLIIVAMVLMQPSQTHTQIWHAPPSSGRVLMQPRQTRTRSVTAELSDGLATLICDSHSLYGSPLVATFLNPTTRGSPAGADAADPHPAVHPTPA